MKSGVRKLVVNADDFGFTRDVNQGIVEAHRHGILMATTLMAAGAFEEPAFDDAVRLARENPKLDIGCHLVLVGAPPFPLSVAQLVQALALKRIRIYDELAAQVRRIVDAGLRPTHLDTHKHTHLLPPVLDAVARLSEEFGIPWVRRPFDFPSISSGRHFARKTYGGRVHDCRLWRGPRVYWLNYGCRSTDHFAGFQITTWVATMRRVWRGCYAHAAAGVDGVHVPSRKAGRELARRAHEIEGEPGRGTARADIARGTRGNRRMRHQAVRLFDL